MKLKLALIPASSFCVNLRKTMKPEEWRKLSREVRSKANRTCQYCGWQEDYDTQEYTHLHEVWEFDEKNQVQKLVGFECICPTCHNVHHWGFAQVSGVDMDKLLKHACKVNGCSALEFKKHIEESFQEWNRRSEIDWQVDLGDCIAKNKGEQI